MNCSTGAHFKAHGYGLAIFDLNDFGKRRAIPEHNQRGEGYNVLLILGGTPEDKQFRLLPLACLLVTTAAGRTLHNYFDGTSAIAEAVDQCLINHMNADAR